MIELPILKSKIKKELNKVNDLINQTLTSETDPTLASIYNHILNNSGKQVRASIIIFIAKCSDEYNENEIIKLAAGIELIHLASLIHDDIIDEAVKRRNQATVHKKFGLNNGILSGVHCYAIALNIIASIMKPELISMISKAVINLCEGESLQINNRHNYNLTIDDYWQIVALKTSSLFETAAECSAYLSNQTKENQKVYSEFGMLLGDIFQLSDDYLDIFDNNNVLNKSIEQDLISGDISLPILLAIKTLNNPTSTKIKHKLIEDKVNISKIIADEINKKETLINSTLKKLEENSKNLNDLFKITEIVTNRTKVKN